MRALCMGFLLMRALPSQPGSLDLVRLLVRERREAFQPVQALDGVVGVLHTLDRIPGDACQVTPEQGQRQQGGRM